MTTKPKYIKLTKTSSLKKIQNVYDQYVQKSRQGLEYFDSSDTRWKIAKQDMWAVMEIIEHVMAGYDLRFDVNKEVKYVYNFTVERKPLREGHEEDQFVLKNTVVGPDKDKFLEAFKTMADVCLPAILTTKGKDKD